LNKAVSRVRETVQTKVQNPLLNTGRKIYNNPLVRILRFALAVFGIFAVVYPRSPVTFASKYLPPSVYKEYGPQLRKWLPREISVKGYRLSGYPREFYDYAHDMAKQMSNPSVMFKGKLQNGQEIMVDDYREAYWWLRDHTPTDSRVLAWWDYGYQIAGMANRTTIADGNTWNHEHIATLGRSLVSPEIKAHNIIRHWADYVLIWSGGGGDDLAKSPHMARIGTSVYPDICPNDPTCAHFGFHQNGKPTPMMEESLLYRLHEHGRSVNVSPQRFKDVYQSKYGKVRIFQVMNISTKSKKWVADPANRVCDAPGSWYCTGQYPPAMQKMFTKWGRRDFAQLEDWNKKRDAHADEHYKKYMERMEGH
jgi:dolichyl-diphosphooligosaccharide--protein glycosyltransferase